VSIAKAIWLVYIKDTARLTGRKRNTGG